MEADAFCLDGDAALALEVHGIEDLFVHFALRERAGHFEQAVGERGFAVIDVRDDAEIPYELRVHFSRLPIFSIAGRMRMARAIFRRVCCYRTSDTRSLAAAGRRKKPCRMNNQFATSPAGRQQSGLIKRALLTDSVKAAGASRLRVRGRAYSSRRMLTGSTRVAR